MKQLVKNFKLTWIFTVTFWQVLSQYRLGAISWIINGAITPILMMSLWLVISGKQQIAMNQSQIVTYYFLTVVVDRLTGSWSLGKIGRQIRDGTFSNSLLKPFSYLVEVMSHSLGIKAIRLLTLIPIIAVIAIIFGSLINLQFSISSVWLFALASLLGFFTRFYWSSLLGMVTFWLEEFYSIENLDGLIGQVLSGGLIPLVLAPSLLRQLITYSPYRFFISFPIEVALGQLGGYKIAEGLVVGTLYLSLLILLNRIIYHLGLRKYGAYGS